MWFGLLPFRSPLLGESLLISFPVLLRWFTSHSLAPGHYLIHALRVIRSRVPDYSIRISGNLWICAPPPGFSQLITSFFASQLRRHPPQTHLSLDHIIFFLFQLYFCSRLYRRSFRQARSSFQLASVLSRPVQGLHHLIQHFPSFTIHFSKNCCLPVLSNTMQHLLEQDRVELSTPALSERCSNQLSYCPGSATAI